MRAARRAFSETDATGDPEVELRQARARLRRTRTRLRTRAAEVARLEAELRQTRSSVRDPHPDLTLEADVRRTIEAVREEHLTYLSAGDLAVLARCAVDAERSQRPGLVVEAGTALGGSAIVMAAAKATSRPMKVYDVFGMIPAPGAEDGDDVHQRYDAIAAGRSRGLGGDTYYGYRDDLYGQVTESFKRHGVPVESTNVELLQGLFEDTIDLDEPVALAHLDGDWYESTMTCLQRLSPLLVPGGRLVIDDYYAWSGCRTAVDEYFADRPGFRIERRTKLHVVRT